MSVLTPKNPCSAGYHLSILPRSSVNFDISKKPAFSSNRLRDFQLLYSLATLNKKRRQGNQSTRPNLGAS